jgi:hypothetical protein
MVLTAKNDEHLKLKLAGASRLGKVVLVSDRRRNLDQTGVERWAAFHCSQGLAGFQPLA